MEKEFEYTKDNRLKRIVLSGPESTGKTTLAEQLAMFFGTVWIPEYAREYVLNLGRNYEYTDVVRIGKKQIEELTSDYPNADRFVFFDTGLIITQIWFIERYKACPDFIKRALQDIKIDLYLLCRPDIEWKKDPVRENNGVDRERLFGRYEEELNYFGVPYKIIEGSGDTRLNNAIQKVEETFGSSTGS